MYIQQRLVKCLATRRRIDSKTSYLVSNHQSHPMCSKSLLHYTIIATLTEVLWLSAETVPKAWFTIIMTLKLTYVVGNTGLEPESNPAFPMLVYLRKLQCHIVNQALGLHYNESSFSPTGCLNQALGLHYKLILSHWLLSMTYPGTPVYGIVSNSCCRLGNKTHNSCF